MNKWYCLIMLVLTCGVCRSQNLVPNSSFETYSLCPNNLDQLNRATPWYNPATLSPDYFNSCNSYVGVPDNMFGYEFAHTGKAYAGIYAYEMRHSNVKEYIRVRLTTPLQAGVPYYVSFYVSLSENSLFSAGTIGAYLSVSDTAPMIGYLMNVVPQIVNSNSFLLAKDGWELIRGRYISTTGGEHYLTIGNFFPDSLSKMQQSPTGSVPHSHSYYYIDDVKVSTDSVLCDTLSLAYDILDATHGLSNGTVQVNVFGGNPPYLYSLNSTTYQGSSTFTALATGTYQVYVIDSNGCSTKDNFTINSDTMVSSQTITGLNSISIFPNPFYNELFIELKKTSSGSLKIIDLLGRVVLVSHYEKTSNIKLNVTQIPQGVYCLEVINNKGEKLHTTLMQIKAGR